MKTNQPIFQHYVPQFQLRCLLNKDGNLFVFDRVENRLFVARPETVGGAKKIYTYKDNHGKEHTEIEDLNTKIETIASPIIKALHFGGKTLITNQEKADLSVLLALNWLRTPAAIERTKVMIEASLVTYMRLNALDKSIFYKQVESLEREKNLKFGDKEKLRQSILGNRYRVSFDNLAYLQSIMFNLLDVANVIQSMQWMVVKLNRDRSFVLPDVNFTIEQVEPVQFPYGSRGLISPGTQSMCVLTNKVAIVMRPTPGGIKFVKPGLDFVRGCNKVNAVRSQRFLFSNSRELLTSVVNETKIHTFPPGRIGIEVNSGPEGKTLRFDLEHGLITE